MTAPLCERIDDFVDGRLDAAGREEMQLHLATCEACQAVLFDSAMLEAIASEAAERKVPSPEKRETPKIAARPGATAHVLPFRRGRSVQYVVTLIAGEERPFLQTLEHWEVGQGSKQPRLALRASSEAVAEPASREAPGEFLAADVLEILVPKVMRVKMLEDAPIEGDAVPTLALGIPLSDGERVNGVACLVF